uniref:TBD domain-containing protein n=1 Tax=Onchocerca flexuosa TaxID=387005 RepID=A0A183I7A7_9BILA
LQEADQELKRLKAEYTKLETRNFHELRQCKQTIAALQQQSLEQVHLSNPSSDMLGNTNVMSISASSSSDRDYDPSLNSGLVVPPLLSHVRPLWDDEPPEIFSSRGDSSLLKKVDPLLNDVTLENSNISHNKGSKLRRSFREREHNIGVSLDGMHPRHKKLQLLLVVG